MAQLTGSLSVSGSISIQGSMTGSFTGSFVGILQGTSSFAVTASYWSGSISNATTAMTASFAVTASYINPTFISASAAAAGFSVNTSSFITATQTASMSVSSASFAVTGAYAVSASQAVTASAAVSASFSSFSTTASFAITAATVVSASYAETASYSKNLRISGSVNNVDYIDFNESAGVTVQSGQLAWNSSDGTLDLGLKGGNVTLQIGQETLYEVRNATGVIISNGTAVYASGVTAGSGRIEASPFTADGSVREIRFLGLATEDIGIGVNGFVTHFGYTRGLDTRGTAVTAISVGDETWSVGDILYAHPTVAGKLTNVKPKHEISVAIVITRHQTTGVLFVRPASFGHLEDNHDVNINTGSLSTGDLLIYDSGSSYWINSKQLSGSYGVTGSWSATSFTGSLSGTSSFAHTASFLTAGATASFATSASRAVTASFATSASLAVTASHLDSMLYDREIHVSNVDGNDSASFGTLLKPFKTIGRAFATVTGNASRIIIHPGTYREDVTLTQSNVSIASSSPEAGGIVFISGSLTINNNGTSIRVDGITPNTLIITGSGTVYLNNMRVSTQFVKLGAGYLEATNCGLQPSAGISLQAGTNVFSGGNIAGVVQSGASTISIVKNAVSLTFANVLGGTLAVTDSPVYSLASGSAAIQSSAGTVVQLFNSQIATPTGVPERINIGGFFGYDDISFNKDASTLGTSLALTADFQNIRGTLIGTASFAVSASWAPGGAAFPFTGSAGITGSVVIDGKLIHGGPQNTANGRAVHLEGLNNDANGNYSHVEGISNASSGDYSHAEGETTLASGRASHAEGYLTLANGNSSHAEGYRTIAAGPYAHAEGADTVADGFYAHAEGLNTTASGFYSHTEGEDNKAYGMGTHVEGYQNLSYYNYQHVVGIRNQALGVSALDYAFIVGNGWPNGTRSNLMVASGSVVQISGSTQISGSLFVNGSQITSGGGTAFPYTGSAGISGSLLVDGNMTQGDPTNTANGEYSHAEGQGTSANGNGSHTEGRGTTATGDYSHAEGIFARANGNFSHAEGNNTQADGAGSHAEGRFVIAEGQYSHAEGIGTITPGNFSHAEGQSTTAQGVGSHAEGDTTQANGDYSHAEGQGTIANGYFSHAEGAYAQANGNYSHAEGNRTITSDEYQHAQGQFNIPLSGSGAFILGNGVDDSTRSNLIVAQGTTVQISGSTQISGSLFVNGSQITSGGGTAFPYTGSAGISGSLLVDGNMTQGDPNNTATGLYSHAEGITTHANGEASHAEGYVTTANGLGSHAEGYVTTANGLGSHAEGFDTAAIGSTSHAEGGTTVANAEYSHAEGFYTTANGRGSHVEGNGTQANGDYSHAEGQGTITLDEFQHAQGKYNQPLSGSGAFILGNGADNFTRRNLIFAQGNTVQITGSIDIQKSAANGIIMTSPDGTRYRVTVANGGTLTTTAI